MSNEQEKVGTGTAGSKGAGCLTMEALNMLGLGAVLGPYQAVKDDVSVCCVRCCAGRSCAAQHTRHRLRRDYR